MRFFGSCVLFVAALTGVLAGGALAVSGVAPAGASPVGITVQCPADNLQNAINSAARARSCWSKEPAWGTSTLTTT